MGPNRELHRARERFHGVLHAVVNGKELPGSRLAQDRRIFASGNIAPIGSGDDIADEASSLNFTLPGSWTNAGKVTFTVEIMPAASMTGTNAGNHTGNAEVTFASPPNWPNPLYIYYWPICFAADASSPANCPLDFATSADADLGDLLPIPENGLVYHPLPTNRMTLTIGNSKTSIDTDNDLIPFMTRLRLAYFTIATHFGLKNMHQLVVWAPKGPPTTAAMADAAWWDNGFAHGWGRVIVVFTDAVNAFYADTLAHEIGHNMGLHHTGLKGIVACDDSPSDAGTAWPYRDIQLHGYAWVWSRPSDFQDGRGRGVASADGAELMSYCFNGNRLPASWTFDYLFRSNMNDPRQNTSVPPYMTVGKDQPAIRRPRQSIGAEADAANLIVVSGTVSADGVTAQLDPVYTLPAANLPLPASDRNGRYCLAFTASPPVSNFCFNISFKDFVNGSTLSKYSFGFPLSAPTGLNRIALTYQGRELATVSGGNASPAVAWQSPKPGAAWQGGTETRLPTCCFTAQTTV